MVETLDFRLETWFIASGTTKFYGTVKFGFLDSCMVNTEKVCFKLPLCGPM